MLQSLSTGGQPSREVFDIDGVTSWPSLQIMAASSKPIRSKADAYKPLTLSFQTHCCCNRIDYDCEDRVRDLLHLDNMVQCSKPKCKRWAFWKCVGLTVDKINDDFHCNDCLVLPPVPKWEISIATNTCPLDNVLAILSVIIKVDPRFLRHVQTESEIENNWRTALTQIQYGKPDEGKHHLLSACVHASTTNVVNFFGGEYSLYGAQLENEGRYLLDLINTSSIFLSSAAMLVRFLLAAIAFVLALKAQNPGVAGAAALVAGGLLTNALSNDMAACYARWMQRLRGFIASRKEAAKNYASSAERHTKSGKTSSDASQLNKQSNSMTNYNVIHNSNKNEIYLSKRYVLFRIHL
ncbi:hypothetical protein QR680_018593 [Steinernema hermaphroditum]|uniref:Uncharacterized protein n=1 Tax=Steinernema hermaphroditum TaxID=289476 RepID=A0AA39LQK7_9BILA|nr:hypothetical protein QR680_018593 [Steinernema hermaphroditum]